MPPVAHIRAKMRRDLLAWYGAHARALPWRARPGERPDPYRVWLSEIMLQQTTVAHATPYFLAFTARWPSVTALAAAADGEVMAAWAGLGYYARARHLLDAARIVGRDHHGAFPDSEDALLALPGVGAYTAAAIAAIAFARPANVADGNVERVMARLFAVETALPAAKPELKRLAGTLVRADRPGDWAQALMDLGATICRPSAPLCDRCPLARDCRALASGAPEAYPRRLARTPRPHRHGVAYVLTRDGQVALIRRPPRGLLGGMLGLPTSDWRAAPWSGPEALAAAPTAGPWRRAGEIRHVFTHFSLTLEIHVARAGPACAGFVWAPIDEALAAVPSLFRKALQGGI
jgi:A/G-specific adenine glycosylase